MSYKDKFYKRYKIKPINNGIVIRPLLHQTNSIYFGLGNAIISINPAFPPPETIVKPITGETSSRSLLPNPPYNAPKWMQIPSNIKNETRELSGGLTMSFKSANLRKFKFVGGDMVGANYSAIDVPDYDRLDW